MGAVKTFSILLALLLLCFIVGSIPPAPQEASFTILHPVSAPPQFNSNTPSLNNTKSETPPMATSLYGIGHPAFQSYNDEPVDIEALVNLAANAGAKVWREAMYANSSTAGYYSNLKSYCDAANMHFIIQTLSYSVGAMTAQQEYDIIEDVGTAQDDWINAWATKIDTLQPYGIKIMNEPSNNGTYTAASEAHFAKYRLFCENCITAWRAVKPDLVILVQNEPFNDLFDSTAYGFGEGGLLATTAGIMYSRHYYYAYDGSYPPEYQPELRAYWNASTPEQLTAAKSGLESFLLSESSPITDLGGQVAWDEWGANVGVANAAQFTTDFLVICKEQGLGAVYYDIVPYGDGEGEESTGILNEDYETLNAVGVAWAANISYAPEGGVSVPVLVTALMMQRR